MSWFKRLIKRDPPPPPPAAHDAEWEDRSDLLAELLEAHGVSGHLARSGIDLPQHGAGANALVRYRQHGPDSWVCTLEVLFGLPGRRGFAEQFVGTGTTREDAMRDAFHAFTLGSLHVILHGVLGLPADEQVTVEEWGTGGIRYEVTIGNVVNRVRGSDEAPPPEGWFPALQAAIEDAGLPAELNFVRFYYGNPRGIAPSVEVMLNNEEWTPVQAAMGSLAWPPPEDFYSVRVFLTLRRLG